MNLMLLSSKHLTRETLAMLADETTGNSAKLGVVSFFKRADWDPSATEPDGFFVQVPSEGHIADWEAEYQERNGACMPQDWKRVLEIADAHSCGYLCIDADAPEVDGLPVCG